MVDTARVTSADTRRLPQHQAQRNLNVGRVIFSTGRAGKQRCAPCFILASITAATSPIPDVPPEILSCELGSNYPRRKRGAVDCTAAPGVAAALLAGGTGNTVTASGLRVRLRSSKNSARC